MIIPKQSIGSLRTSIPVQDYDKKHQSGVKAQQFLGCKTSPCINGKQYRICVTRKTICKEISGSEELGIPSEVICFPGDYDVRVQEIACRIPPVYAPKFSTRFGLLGS